MDIKTPVSSVFDFTSRSSSGSTAVGQVRRGDPSETGATPDVRDSNTCASPVPSSPPPMPPV